MWPEIVADYFTLYTRVGLAYLKIQRNNNNNNNNNDNQIKKKTTLRKKGKIQITID